MPTPQTTTFGGSLRGRFTSSLSCRSYNWLSFVRWASPPTLISKCSSLFSSSYLYLSGKTIYCRKCAHFCRWIFFVQCFFFFIKVQGHSLLTFYFKVQGHRFVTYFHAGKIIYFVCQRSVVTLVIFQWNILRYLLLNCLKKWNLKLDITDTCTSCLWKSLIQGVSEWKSFLNFFPYLICDIFLT